MLNFAGDIETGAVRHFKQWDQIGQAFEGLPLEGKLSDAWLTDEVSPEGSGPPPVQAKGDQVHLIRLLRRHLPLKGKAFGELYSLSDFIVGI